MGSGRFTSPVRLITLISWVLWTAFCKLGSPIQRPGLRQTVQSKERAAFVKAEFLSAYRDYVQYGYPSDEILPVVKKGQNTRNGWSATLVDALDTLLLMDLKDEFDDAVQKTLKINFKTSRTWTTVSIMETTIRYLGGVLSAYELTGATNQGLLELARTIGDTLARAWRSDEQQLPYSRFYTTFNIFRNDQVSLAAAGSLIIEFDRLSHYSGDDKYRKLAERAEKFLMTTPGTLPGMPPLLRSVKDNSVVEDWVTWGGGADSYYEYLLKYAMLTNNADPSYSKCWKTAVDSSIEHLLTRSPAQGLVYLADFSPSQGGKDLAFSHLACFAGGNWMLGGKWLDNQQYLQHGLELVETCMKSYTSTKTGLGPDAFRFNEPPTENDGNAQLNAQDDESFRENGYYVTDPKYILRPEVLESAFYAWRITGDKRYQDFVWNAFTALKKHCKAPAGYSAIDDVNSAHPQLTNNCESFLYSETFKYIYLTFAPPDLISLDDYVFNTEAHPFRYKRSNSKNHQEQVTLNVGIAPETIITEPVSSHEAGTNTDL